jgi:thiamine-monophosphate kinase
MPLKEKDLIQRIRKAAQPHRAAGDVGIGDDCAVLSLPREHQLLVTTDFSLEDVHFRQAWHPPDSVGYRCIARGLSDIAAMGGTPLSAFLSLALPADLPQAWVDHFLKGLLKLARRHRVTLSGGDTAQSPAGILADIMVLGSVPVGRAILRSGARPGDSIYVTGSLGSSVATLQRLRDGKQLGPASQLRHFYPEPRLAIGKYLREKKLASAMIDTSDGLSTDLEHICQESGVGAVIHAEALPASLPGEEGLQLALHGGEDYELLFTARPNRRIPKTIAHVPVTRIGEVVRRTQVKLVRDGKSEVLRPQGWEHFS